MYTPGGIFIRNPRIRFAEPPADPPPGGGNPPTDPPADPLTDRGFPANTPVAEMTHEQQAAYWRDQSKTQQKKVDAEAARAAAAEKERDDLRTATLTEQQQAVETARREGENLGAQRYLTDAIKAQFQLLTGKDETAADAALEVVDMSKFVTDAGAIDLEKIKSYAGTFGAPAPAGEPAPHAPTDLVAEAIARTKQPAPGTATGSIKELQRQRVEALTQKK
jgi:hypothetical protein